MLPLLLAALAADPTAHPKPDLLTEPVALQAALSTTRVLDARGKNDYLRGHVPGAVWVDALAWDKAFRPGQDATAWATRLGQLGVRPADPVVVVGGNDVRDAARVWWILRYWGFDKAGLLNGGYGAWAGPTAADDMKPTATTVTLTPRTNALVTKEQLLAMINGKPPRIVDGRSDDEFCGKAETAKRNGAVPGAVHLEWTECLDAKTHRFKSAAELTALLASRKIDVREPVVTYCQSGGRASVVAFALELMGGTQVGNYYRSWSEWGNDPNTPVEIRKKD